MGVIIRNRCERPGFCFSFEEELCEIVRHDQDGKDREGEWAPSGQGSGNETGGRHQSNKLGGRAQEKGLRGPERERGTGTYTVREEDGEGAERIGL